MARRRPVGREAASMVRLHKSAGFDLILWKVFKVVCEFDTKVGVRRDMGVPDDTLRQAVDEAKQIGIDLYGWFRVSNEDSKPGSLFGPTTPFHLAHPEKRQVTKSGIVRPRMSFAYPEVRQHKINMIREVVAYGLDSILFGPHLPTPEFPPADLELGEYVAKATDRAEVFGQVWRYGSFVASELLAKQLYDQGVHGAAIYESETAVQRPSFWERAWRYKCPDCLAGRC